MNITSKTAEAAKEFLAAQHLTTVASFYAEQEDADADEANAKIRNIPCVNCTCSDAQEFPPRSGNYKLNLKVLVQASFDDTTSDGFVAMCGEVFAKIHTSTIAADLTDALDDFTCIGIGGAASQVTGIDSQKRLRRQELTLPIYVCASDLAA